MVCAVGIAPTMFTTKGTILQTVATHLTVALHTYREYPLSDLN